jgi:hypothetical protein
MLMWNIVSFCFPCQLLQGLGHIIVIRSLKKCSINSFFAIFFNLYGPKVVRGSIGSFVGHSLFMGDNISQGSN